MKVTHVNFRQERVHVTVPFRRMVLDDKIYEVKIGRKDPSPTTKDVRVVINFHVYWESDDGDTIPITDFRPHGMDLKVGYRADEEGRQLSYQTVGDEWIKIDHVQVPSAVDKETAGYGVTTLMYWPSDPNVGWGGG